MEYSLRKQSRQAVSRKLYLQFRNLGLTKEVFIMKIFCIGKNYADHVKEMNSALPETPVVFMKPSTALLGNGKTFYLPEFSNNIHYECEYVVKINQTGKSIPLSSAINFVDEVTLGIDFTARDVQAMCKEKKWPWEIAKSFDYSAAVGEFVSMNIKELMETSFEFKVNDDIVQKGDPHQMIFKIPEIIHYISQRFTLQKGDLIFTGTPSGVGQVSSGDVLEGYLNDKKVLFTDIK